MLIDARQASHRCNQSLAQFVGKARAARGLDAFQNFRSLYLAVATPHASSHLILPVLCVSVNGPETVYLEMSPVGRSPDRLRLSTYYDMCQGSMADPIRRTLCG